MPQSRFVTPPEIRFWRHVNKDGPIPETHPELGNCWLWTGARENRDEYGLFWAGAKTPAGNSKFIPAHRFAYGSVPEGMEISHLCEIRLCVRRSHLIAGTHRENMRYGNGRIARQAKQTHCIRGHAFDKANTIIRPNGSRMCIACVSARLLEGNSIS